MTKFILHGGGEMQRNEQHDEFFREFISNLPREAKVLLVYFAITDEEIPQKHPIYEDYFIENNFENKKIELKIASRDNLTEEIKWADGVYFRGGNTDRLLTEVRKHKDFTEELLKKKVVAGSSAGVYFLSKHALSSSCDIIYKGLGILPIKANCHYEEGKDLSRLDQFPDEELFLLKEGEYEIIEK
jgi:peptidase E